MALAYSLLQLDSIPNQAQPSPVQSTNYSVIQHLFRMGNADSQPIQKLQADLGYTFQNKELLKQALTHDSLRVSNPSLPTYQRLEFLGDSVIQFVITDFLYNKFPKVSTSHGFLKDDP